MVWLNQLPAVSVALAFANLRQNFGWRPTAFERDKDMHGVASHPIGMVNVSLHRKPIRFNKNSFFTPIRLFILGVILFCISSFIYLNNGLPNRAAAQLKILNAGDIGHDEFRTYLHAQPNYCEYKDVTPNICNEQFLKYKRMIAVVGDSHAEHVLLGLIEEMPDTGFMLFDTNQTLPFISSQLSNHFFDVIDANSKIDTVVLVAYWHLRKQLIAPGSSYLQEITPTAEKLTVHGKKVFLILWYTEFQFFAH